MTLQRILIYVGLAVTIFAFIAISYKLITNSCSDHSITYKTLPNEMKPSYMVTVNDDKFEKERKLLQLSVQEHPPEVQTLKRLLIEIEQDNSKFDNLISIGDIYRKGAFPRLLPNINIALECFKIASMCPNGKIAGMAQAKYIEARLDPIDTVDQAGDPLPEEYGEKACEICYSFIKTASFDLFEKPIYTTASTNKSKQPVLQAHDAFDYNDFFTGNIEDLYAPYEANMVQEIHLPTEHAYTNDSQNVHDHSVVAVTKKTLESLKNEAKDSVDAVRNGILSSNNLLPHEQSDALKVLDSLNELNHSSFQISEQNALNSVWKKVSEIDNEEIRSNVKETLYKQLASGVEHGHVVCSTGKITRITSALDGVEEVKKDVARPMWAIKDEIANLASKVRDDYLASLDPSIVTEYENGLRDDIVENMKNEFEKKVLHEYVDNLGLNKKVIEPIVETYKEGY